MSVVDDVPQVSCAAPAGFVSWEQEQCWVALEAARVARTYTLEQVHVQVGFARLSGDDDTAVFEAWVRAAVLLCDPLHGPVTREQWSQRNAAATVEARRIHGDLSDPTLVFLAHLSRREVDLVHDLVWEGDDWRRMTCADVSDLDDLAALGLVDARDEYRVTDLGTLVLAEVAT